MLKQFKVFFSRIVICIITLSIMTMSSNVVMAFTDVSNMSDEVFFGVWNGSQWTTVGKIDYSYDSGLTAVENYVKAGNYTSAKDALLTYYQQRTSISAEPLGSGNRNTVDCNMICENIFTSSGEYYLTEFTVDGTLETSSIDVFDGVNVALNENKQITFILMGRYKTSDVAIFNSSEAGSNNPVLEVTVNEQTYSFPAVKDSYIQGGIYGDTNLGSNGQIAIKDSGAPVDLYSRKGYMQFDMSSLPDGTPTSAMLNLYGHNASSQNDMTISIYRIADTVWDEASITWNNAYANTFSWQGVSGGTDWLLPQGASAQYLNVLSRFYNAPSMAYEYYVTSNEKYASNLIRLMLDFISDQGNNNPGYNQDELDASIRAYMWIRSYDYIKNSSSMDSEANTAILKFFWQMGEFLEDPNNYYTISNYGMLESRGLYSIGVFFPEFRDAQDYVNTAESRLDSLVKTLNHIDGSYTEDNTQYNGVTASTLYSIKKMGEVNNRTFSETFNLAIKRMAKFIMDVGFPNGNNPGYGDDDYVANKQSLILDMGYTYNDENLKYWGSGGTIGSEPNYKSIFYSENNTMYMRSGWNSDSLYMHINNYNGVHAHTDLLSVIAYGYGRQLLVDPGRYSYTIASLIVMWLRRSCEAHNCVEVNDNPAQMLTAETTVHNAVINNSFDFYEGSHNSYSDCEVYRSVLFVKPNYWIVSDYIDSDVGSDKYQQTWHFAPGANASIDGSTKKAKTNFSSGSNIQVVPADPASFTATLEQGYYSSAYMNVTYADYASYVRNVSDDTTFDTVLYPTDEQDNRDVQVERLSTGVGTTVASALKVYLDYGNNGDLGYYYISHESSPKTERTFGSYAFDGKMAYVETDYSGNLKSSCIKSGKVLKRNSTNLIENSTEINDIAVEWDGSRLLINGNGLKEDSNAGTAVAIFAPSATSVQLNGNSVSYTRVGNYVYAVCSISKTEYDAKDDYSSTQGDNNWYYQNTDGSTYSNLTWNSSTTRWETSGIVHPYVGRNIQSPGTLLDSVRKWVAPYDGVITITGNVAGHPSYTSGDGRNVRILKNSTNVWPDTGWQYIGPLDTAGYDINETLEVNQGDSIYFILNRYNSASSDHIIWEPEISLYPGMELFCENFEDENANGWTPLTPSRWTVGTDSGDYSYYINTSSYSNQSGDRPGEYSLLDNSDYDTFVFDAKVKSGENLGSNTGADLVVLFNYQDSNNYYYMMMNNLLDLTQLFKVKNGARSLLADSDGATDWVADNNYHTLSIERNKNTGSIIVRYEGNAVIIVNDDEFNGGQVGIGSYNDMAYFDNINIIVME